jgi:hypothetical protein
MIGLSPNFPMVLVALMLQRDHGRIHRAGYRCR